MEKISTTALAKKHKVLPKALFQKLLELKLVTKDGENWALTEQGQNEGGEYKHSKRFGTYIIWPKDIGVEENRSQHKSHEEFKALSKVEETAAPYAQDASCKKLAQFRKKFPANCRCDDGHYVRSRGEAMIDNWLYRNGIVHAYERKLPIEEDVYSDFFIPNGNVYIEYWGMEQNQYLIRKEEKLKIYEKYQYNLIQIDNDSINLIDDILPKQLIKHGVKFS